MMIPLDQSVAVVTGGAGFVGSHLVDALVKEGARVRVVDSLTRGESGNLAEAKKSGRVELVTGDIRDEKLWDRVLLGADLVFHQAALRVNRCEENPRECWTVMVEATRSLFEACAAHKLKKIVLASSAIVYGAADQLPTPETHHLNYNTTWYGAAKIANEQLLNVLYAREKLPGLALRYFNIYGSRMATQGHPEVLVKWFQTLDHNKPLRIFGDGSQTMDWVHVRDVARANILAAQSPVASGVFNIGTGVETALHELAKLVLKSWGRAGKPEIDPSHSLVNPIPRRWADISAARRHLGFQPEFPLDKGLAEMVEWWKAHARVA